jgi:hypothetical protein
MNPPQLGGDIVQPYQPPWITPDWLGQVTQPGEELPKVAPRRNQARPYGRLAGRIAKAGGLVLLGGAGFVLGAPFGYHHAGTEAFRHAFIEVEQIFEDPWEDD